MELISKEKEAECQFIQLDSQAISYISRQKEFELFFIQRNSEV